MKNHLIKFISVGLTLVISFALVFFAVPKSWSPPPPSVEIRGETIVEKVASLQVYLNEGEEDNFWRVFFEDYNAKTKVWKFTVMVLDPYLFSGSASDEGQQLRREKFFSILKEIFANMAKWDETADGVVVRISMPISSDPAKTAYGVLYMADKEGLSNIRVYPENWGLYMYPQEELMEFSRSEIEALLRGGEK